MIIHKFFNSVVFEEIIDRGDMSNFVILVCHYLVFYIKIIKTTVPIINHQPSFLLNHY